MAHVDFSSIRLDMAPMTIRRTRADGAIRSSTACSRSLRICGALSLKVTAAVAAGVSSVVNRVARESCFCEERFSMRMASSVKRPFMSCRMDLFLLIRVR